MSQLRKLKKGQVEKVAKAICLIKNKKQRKKISLFFAEFLAERKLLLEFHLDVDSLRRASKNKSLRKQILAVVDQIK